MSESAPRPPYVRFERRAVSKKQPDGRMVFTDVDYSFVSALGSRDVTVRKVDYWFEYVESQVARGKMPREWLEHFRRLYEAFKNDQELPENGLSVKNWPAASKSEMDRLWAAGVRTVEDLAQANEEMLHAIGMGSRALKRRAEDWLSANSGEAVKLVAEVTELRKANAALLTRIESLEAQATAARAVPAPTAPEATDIVDELVG